MKFNLRFKPRARLLLQLGDQLIKNESIALVELVKNSYDADANTVNIYMEKVDDPNNGTIIIEDDGCGMNLYTVENVWLEPGSDFKTLLIKNSIVSDKYKRLPIGEKGIGRFGVHKLGNIIEMTTKSTNFNEVYVRIDWRDFENYKYLEDVPISIVERPIPILFKNGKTGTNIQITNLRRKWERGIAREVQRSITALASPFENSDSFHPFYTVVDKPEWFEGLLKWDEVKDFSLFKFKIKMDGDSITYFQYAFTPWSTMIKLTSRSTDINDALVSKFKTLRHVEHTEANKYGDRIDLGKHKIGVVTLEGFIFDRDPFILKLGVSDKTGFKKYLDNNGGVKVFRDNLRVYDYGEPENDWLGLDIRRVNEPTKRISNNILLSAISINRRDSSDLVEKTNREGFLENSAYNDFRGAILHCFEIIETLRYQDKIMIRNNYGPTPKSSPVASTISEAIKYVETKITQPDIRNQLIKYFNKIESDYKTISHNLLKAAGAGLSMSVVIHEVEKIIYEVQRTLKVEKGSEKLLNLVKHLSSLIDGYAEIIRKSNKTTENIIQLIDQALFNTEYRLSAHKIQIINAYRNFSGNPKIKLAKNLIIGTIMNIIDNSIFWLDQKGFNSNNNLSSTSKKIYINLVEDKNFMYIIIADNGTGFLIPTENITEPFVSAKPGGIGLGLHIANEIMEAQNGKLLFPEIGDFEMPNEYNIGATIVLAFKK